MRDSAYRRVLTIGLAVLLQIAVMVVSMMLLSAYRRWIDITLTVLSVLAVIRVIYDRSDPSYKIAWIILILAFPVAGICIYLAFGGRRLRRSVRKRMILAEDLARANLNQEAITWESLERISDPACACVRYVCNVTGYPVYDNTETEYFPLGDAAYPKMLEELRKAEKYIFLEYFIIGSGVMWDGILKILKEKAAHGVDVRVIYDSFGCITTLPNRYDRELGKYGIRAMIFNPMRPVLSGRMNNRSHRKLMIIDGKVGFTGGINLADEYINQRERFGHWKDCAICLRGEAVWAMTVMFLSMWDSQNREDEYLQDYKPDYPYRLAGGEGFVQPFCDSPLDRVDVSENLLLNLFQRASRSICIMTPYLILDDKIASALIFAAQAGVEVKIITPHVPDKRYVHAVTRSYYEMLLEAGVRIFEYTPGFIHSKVYLIDGRYAVTGTVNLDFRSLYLHYEDAVFLYEAGCIDAIFADFETTFPQCEEITLRQYRSTAFWRRLLRALLRLFAPLM